MRDVLRSLRRLPDHVGLAYDMWAPVAATGDHAGKVPDDDRDEWFERLEGQGVNRDYEQAYARWYGALEGLQATVAQVVLSSRLLIGHGNPSAAEVGLTVHHTWGVPLLPGSSLKGLLHHAVVDRYGPDSETWSVHPLAQEDEARAGFQPAYWEDRHARHGPGVAVRSLFGAPAADSDRQWQRPDEDAPVGAQRGGLSFLDAWLVPNSVDRPFRKDTLTVHQRGYYGQSGDERSWPNDYEGPNPVGFLTVRPGPRFLLAIAGSEPLARWAMDELLLALDERGIGGKTTSGYGRLVPTEGTRVQTLRPPVESALVDDLRDLLERRRRPAEWSEEEEPSWRQLSESSEANRLVAAISGQPEAVAREAIAVVKKSRLYAHRKLNACAVGWVELIGDGRLGFPALHALRTKLINMKPGDAPAVDDLLLEIAADGGEEAVRAAIRLVQHVAGRLDGDRAATWLEILREAL